MEHDQDMAELPSARPQFMNLSEAAVWKAIDGDAFGENPITAEVTRLIANHAARYKACVDRHGSVLPHMMHIQVRWPIERVAVLLLAGFAGGTAGRLH